MNLTLKPLTFSGYKKEVDCKKIDKQAGRRDEAWVQCFTDQGNAKVVRASQIGTIQQGSQSYHCDSHFGTPYKLFDRDGKEMGHIRLRAWANKWRGGNEPGPSEAVQIIAEHINKSKPGQIINLTC